MQFKNQQKFYQGKVRDVYHIGEQFLVMVASNRISAFDHILPKEIPYKGHILNKIAFHFLKKAESIVPHWLIAAPLPNVSIGKKCEVIPLEMVIRGNLSGHAWRTYQSGKRILCGVTLPEGMRENDFFPEPIITPATKAKEGHDEDISKEEILSRGIVSEAQWNALEKYTRQLFEMGKAYADTRDLILVDTKYEFGLLHGKICLMDEIHTPDSSRYFYKNGFEENQKNGVPQKQLSKEFVREWLMDNGFQGLEGQQMPSITDEVVDMILGRYIELYEQLIGEKFIKQEVTETDIENTVNQFPFENYL